MTEDRYNQNQTQFAAEKPLLEIPVEPPPAPKAEEPVKITRPQWLLPVVGGVSILLIIILVLAFRNRGEPPSENGPHQPTTSTPVLSPLEQRLEATKVLLQDANPTVQDLPFPPLDMKLRIDGR